jgi:hypothetical protein
MSVTVSIRQFERKKTDYENNQQDVLYRLIYYSKSPLHVSGNVFAHHQEHLNVFRISGNIRPSSCRLVLWMIFNSSKTPAGSNLRE